SAEHRCQLLGLLVARSSVDEHAESPVSLAHHFWRVCDRRDLEAADVRSVDLAGDDVEDERYPTAVVVSTERERRGARAHHLARARFEIGTAQLPRHCRSSLELDRMRGGILAPPWRSSQSATRAYRRSRGPRRSR